MRKHTKRVPRVMLAVGLLYFTMGAGSALGATGQDRSGSEQELLLVRAWNPQTGELIGWMPLHRVAVTLERIGEGGPSFDLNEAVAVNFPYRPDASPKYGGVHVTPEPTTFQGRQWIPAESAPNLVRIRRWPFNVKVIDFGDSKWQRASIVSAVSQTQPR